MSFFLSIFFLSLVVGVMIIGFGSEIGIVVYGSVMVSLLLYMYIELRDKIDKILKDDKE
ncbi:MAG: hypothetical protein KMY55_01885 [Dethiosulfatibacter sp.]|nr:hypothetical protein [Dethiosulfatibacter sp.]